MSNKVMIAVLGVALMFLFSCGSSRKGSTGVSENVLQSGLSYETFSAKVTVTVGGMNVNATLRMKKDSFLFISVQPFAGVEVARVFVSDSEVCLVDRVNKRYSQFAIKEIPDYGELLGVGKLQAMFTDQLFLLREDDKAVSLSDFSVTQIASFWMLQYSDPKNRFSQEFTADEHYRVSNATLTSPHGLLRWEYSQPEPLDNGYMLPRKITLTMSKSRDNGFSSYRNQQEITVYYKKIDLNKACSFSNPIPRGYEKVSVEELLSVLNNKR